MEDNYRERLNRDQLILNMFRRLCMRFHKNKIIPIVEFLKSMLVVRMKHLYRDLYFPGFSYLRTHLVQ